ncbi:hypothetical protein ABIB40_000346 [Pedobacter sp. UYP30]|uniref:hypothetical protein n=1 Tax=Pedobacter sp. UYP30 TaxID=1756400 RepID=UPI0033951AAE
MIKTLLTFLFLLTITLTSRAQTLTEVISLNGRSISDINSFLSKNGWDFYSNKNQTDSTYGYAGWSFKQPADTVDLAEYWIFATYKDNKAISIMSKTSDRDFYNHIVAYLKKINAENKEETLFENAIRTVHLGKKYVYILSVSSRKGVMQQEFQIEIFDKRYSKF